MKAITPNGVLRVNTIRWRPSDLLTGVDLRDTRRARLTKFAASRGVSDNPGGLGELIGKKGNQVYNLLHGTASFGEKVARSIESSAGLPAGWLDVDDEQPQLWPFERIDVDRILRLSREDFIRLETRLEKDLEQLESAGISAIPNGGYVKTPVKNKKLPDSRADTDSSTDEARQRLMRESEAGAVNEAGRAVRRVPGKRGGRRP